jgi:signal transduction histidine kinase
MIDTATIHPRVFRFYYAMNWAPMSKNTLRTSLLLAIAIPIVIMTMVASVLLLEVHRLSTALQWVDRTDQVIGAEREMLKLNLDMETALRGFQYTGETEYLQPYKEAEQGIDSKFAALNEAVSDPAQKALNAKIRSDFEDWRRRAETAIAARAANPAQDSPALRHSETLERKTLMDKIREEYEVFNDRETILRADRVRSAQRGSRLVSLTCFLIAFGGAGILTLFSRRQIHQMALEQLLREKRVQALAHMASRLAHEINNPLAIIYGEVTDLQRLAARDAPPSNLEMLRACDTIVEASDRAIKTLRGLKGFANGEEIAAMAPASVAEVIQHSMELSQARFLDQDIETRLEIDPGLPLIPCREAEIGQILTNLIDNAFDAIVQSHATERWISLKAARSDGNLCIDVSDSGPGIGDKFKPYLMEHFFSGKESGGATGVGLSFSRAIAENHGGTLILRENTRNTCFRLLLPI